MRAVVDDGSVEFERRPSRSPADGPSTELPSSTKESPTQV